MRFHQKKKDIMAVGDEKGQLSLLELPHNLYKMNGNETETVLDFWNRERDRVIYVEERFEQRKEEE